MKIYFISGTILTIAYGMQILNPDPNARMKIIIPVLILFFVTFLAFIIEYESHRRNAWSKKEKKLIESVQSKYMELYFKKTQSEKRKKAAEEEKKRQMVEKKVKQGYSPLGNFKQEV